jgi:hypothetical protein
VRAPSSWLGVVILFGAIIVVSFVANADKAAETPIKFQTKAANVIATDEIRVSNISDKEDMVVEALGISVEGLDGTLLPQIGCLAITASDLWQHILPETAGRVALRDQSR